MAKKTGKAAKKRGVKKAKRQTTQKRTVKKAKRQTAKKKKKAKKAKKATTAKRSLVTSALGCCTIIYDDKESEQVEGVTLDQCVRIGRSRGGTGKWNPGACA